MTKILVVDDDSNMRELIKELLTVTGYEVIEEADGASAYAAAVSESPQLIVLDVMMPEMDGFEVLAKLRENPATEAIPVILLTAVPAESGELAGLDLGVEHYVTKPWVVGNLEAAVRVALREAGIDDESLSEPVVTKTSNVRLNGALGGGIPLGSLTLIEGTSSSGKSVLCQQLSHESLISGHGVAYFTFENTARSLISQMKSIGLDVSDSFRKDLLRIHPMEEPGLDEEPEQLIASLVQDMEALPSQYKTVILDSITNLVAYSDERSIIRFFYSCRRLCDNMRTVILVAHSSSFEEKLLSRLRSLCDAHLSLHVEQLGAKLVKMLEVTKVHNAEQATGNVVNFEVVPEIGMQIIPGSKIRV